MAIALWIVQGLLGLIFVITGSFKFFQSKEKVIASGGTWAEDFAPGIIKTIAGAELISGVLVIVPRLLGHGRRLYCIDNDRGYIYAHQAEGISACGDKFGVFIDGVVCGLCKRAFVRMRR